MTGEYVAIFLCIALVAVWIKPLGGYMAAVYLDLPHPLKKIVEPFERLIYRLCFVHPEVRMSWRGYSFCAVVFTLVSSLLLFMILLLQGVLPLNPQNLPGIPPALAFNITMSFLSGTDWQSYSGEQTLSYFSQTVGLGMQFYFSAAIAMAVAVAFCRAFASRQASTIGNFWVDMLRSILYILLPLSFIFGLFLAADGVIQNYDAYVSATTLEGERVLIAQGPAAWHSAIMMLGSNGGGFFNANAAHPYANPTAVTGLLYIASILLLPVTFVYTAGILMRDRRMGFMMLTAMTIIFVPLTAVIVTEEYSPSPRFDPIAIDTSEGNMEGKEIRFGHAVTAFWSAAATATTNGSGAGSYDSSAPLSGMSQMFFMQIGEAVYGGIGSGVYSMMLYVMMAVFIAGLMVGRTPELMGKKLTPFDMKMASTALLLPTCLALIGTAIAVSTEAGRSSVSNPSAHGFSQILYAFSSAANNNGSAYGGLNSNTPFYNIMLGLCMVLGRFGVMLPILALAGSFAAKNITPPSAGTLPTHTPLFAVMLVMVIIMIGLLSYVPAVALGPIAEHFRMMVEAP